MSQLHRKLCGQPRLPRRTQPAAAYRAGTGPSIPLSLMPWLAGPSGRVPPAGFNPAMGLRSPDTGHTPGAVFRIRGTFCRRAGSSGPSDGGGAAGGAAVAGAWAARRPGCGSGAGRPPSDCGLSGPHRPAREHRPGGRSSRVQAGRARPDPLPTAGSRPALTCRRDCAGAGRSRHHRAPRATMASDREPGDDPPAGAGVVLAHPRAVCGACPARAVSGDRDPISHRLPTPAVPRSSPRGRRPPPRARRPCFDAVLAGRAGRHAGERPVPAPAGDQQAGAARLHDQAPRARWP